MAVLLLSQLKTHYSYFLCLVVPDRAWPLSKFIFVLERTVSPKFVGIWCERVQFPRETMLNNILIVDDELSLLLSIEERFAEFRDTIKVFTAENKKAAVQILESVAIDFVVTDIKTPIMDGFELLAYINSRLPEIPVAVMSACRTPDLDARLGAMGILRILKKPIDFNELVHTVQEGLAYAAQQGALSGISVDSFLQLIEMEEKTCSLDVRNQQRQKGFFYFYQGQLYDAVCGDLKGRDAAVEMVTWDNARLNLKNLPGKRMKKRIPTGLMSILMEASKIRDEAREKCGTDFTSFTNRHHSSKPISRHEDIHVENKAEPFRAGETVHRSREMVALFREAAERAGDILSIGMAKMDGTFIAGYSPVDMDGAVFSAKMAKMMDALVEPVQNINQRDTIREVIVQTDKIRVACRCMAADVYLGIMAGRDCTLGRIQRLLDEIAGKLAGFF